MQQLFQELPDLKVDKLQKRPDCELYKSPNFLKRSQNDGFWHYMLKILEIPSLEIDFTRKNPLRRFCLAPPGGRLR